MTVAATLRKLVLPNARRLLVSQPVSDLVSRSFHGDIPSRGLRFRVDNPAVGSKTAAELFFRLYERHEIAFVRNQMLSRCDVLELGAGIGVTGGYALHQLGSDRRLIAVEANQALLPILRANLDRHRRGHDVVVLHGAVSYSGSSHVMLHQSIEHMRSHVGLPPYVNRTVDAAVPAFTLGDLVDRFGLEDYVLISDIEGAEQDVIMRDAPALASCQQLIIELHGVASQLDEMSKSLAGLGFVAAAQRKTIYAFTRRHS